ncbi:hypothetical protein QF001_001696 [Paraburkholderia youngii]
MPFGLKIHALSHTTERVTTSSDKSASTSPTTSAPTLTLRTVMTPSNGAVRWRRPRAATSAEHDTDGEGRDENRHGDFARALRIASCSGAPRSRWCVMFSVATVESSISTPTASASPPSVMMLMVSPSAESTISDVSTESGIVAAMMSVARQLPRKSRIIAAVRHAAISGSRTTPAMADFTKTDWSAIGVILNVLGRPAAVFGSSALTLLDDGERRGAASFFHREQRAAGRLHARCWFAAGSRRSR